MSASQTISVCKGFSIYYTDHTSFPRIQISIEYRVSIVSLRCLENWRHLSLCMKLNEMPSTVQLQSFKELHSLFVLLQFSIQPAIFLFRDQQCDDVTLLEAQQRVVVSRFVGEYGAHFRSFVDVIEASGHRHRPGQSIVFVVF